MRTCATASVIAIFVMSVPTTFAACASSSPTEATSPDGAQQDKQDKPDDGANGESKPDAPAGTTAAAKPATPAAARKKPETVADCRQMLTEIVNDQPDAGVVMNNAQTAGDAGSSDRFTPVNELIKSKRDAFRCCFDIWARTNPGQKGKVAFTFSLAPDGTLKSAKIKTEESDLTAPAVEACMVEVAKSMTYPPSPSGRDTLFTYPFEFKPRR